MYFKDVPLRLSEKKTNEQSRKKKNRSAIAGHCNNMKKT